MKLLPLTFLIALTTVLPLRAQELKDPGFETPGPALVSTSDAASGKAQISGIVADGWQDNTSWADVVVAYALDSNNPHGGRTSQKITVTRGFAQFVQPVSFQPARCRVSLWVRAEPAQWVALSLRQAASPYSYYASAPIRATNQWTQMSVEGVTPSLAGYFMVNASAPGTIWLDDAALTRSVGGAGQALSPPARSIPRTYFGLNVNHMHDSPGFLWPLVPFGTFRTWDSGDVWAEIEPQRGVYDWRNLDRDLYEAEAHGTQVLFTLGQTPLWASSDPTKPSVYGNGRGAPPANVDDWKDFVHTAATRYKGRIHAYEVWNEPDLDFYTGTPAQMVPLERSTAEVVKQADPDAPLLAPAPSGISLNSLKWYDDYLSAGGGRLVDGYAVHLYQYPAEGDIPALGSFRSVLAAHGLGRKPIWNTESGLNRERHTIDDAAAFVAQEHVLDWALGFDRLCYYAYDNEYYFGLDKSVNVVHADKSVDKIRDAAHLNPDGVAYEQVQQWLVGAVMVSCASDRDGTWTTALLRPKGHRAWVVWNPDGSRPLAVPPSWKVKTQRNLGGVVSPVSGGFAVTPAPVLLEP